MKATIKRDRFIVIFFTFLIFLLIFQIFSLFYQRNLDRLQIASDDRRYISFILADELRQTSDDLTKMVRLYVVTGDPKYKQRFQDIIDIREGLKPRPKDYHLIYWDLVDHTNIKFEMEGPSELKQEMIKQKFTVQEFNLLMEAMEESDRLIDMEQAAMNAVDGRYDDGSGNFLIEKEPDKELAQRLVFGDDYMKAKAKIMKPLLEFLKHVEQRTEAENNYYDKKSNITILISIVIACIAAIIMIVSIVKTLISLMRLNRENEALLLNILPSPIADRLKHGEKIIADKYPQVSILFADIVNFTSMTNDLGPTNIVRILNEVFAEFDSITEEFHIEKIKTIGDNYMAVSGVPIADTNHANNIASFALAITEKLENYNKEHNLTLQLRIGMSYGSVIAGVIGQKKFVYDLWGDGVNIASRMESTSIPGKIHVTEKMKMLLEEEFTFEEREDQEIKGIGRMKTYFLTGRKERGSQQPIEPPIDNPPEQS